MIMMIMQEGVHSMLEVQGTHSWTSFTQSNATNKLGTFVTPRYLVSI